MLRGDRGWIGRRAPFAAVAALVALGCLLPAAATAAKKEPAEPGAVKTRSATAAGAGNQTIISATALCPKGTSVVGGGYLASPGFTLDVQIFVFESFRAGRRGWRATAQMGDSSAPSETATLTTFAYCRSGVPKLSTRTATVATPATSGPTVGPTATARCPKGRKAVAGGFATRPPIAEFSTASIFVTDSYRATKSSWANRVLIGGPAGSLSTFAYCAEGKAPRTFQGSSPVTTASFVEAAAVAACTGKRKPVAGGFRQDASGDGSGAGTGLYIVRESQAVGKGWLATGTHVFPQPTTLTSIAYCG